MKDDIKIDCKRLEYFLSSRQWEQGDRETWIILSQLANKPRETYFSQRDLNNIPNHYLELIDLLWVVNSGGKFGYRIQTQIFSEVKQEYHLFCDRVGWPFPPPFNPRTAVYDYSDRSATGHLPSPRWFGGSSWHKHLHILNSKLERCGVFAANAEDSEINLIATGSQTNNNLVFVSDRGIDYTPLFNLLKNRQWFAANQETERVLLEATAQQRRGWLGRDDINLLPCQDLEIIDALWLKYSQKRFGFSMQHNIWQNSDRKNYKIFGEQVGWCNNGSWLTLNQLNFSINAELGHLPVLSWWFGNAVWGLKGLFKKMDACNFYD